MRDITRRETNNPVFRKDTFAEVAAGGEAMTLDGTVNRCFALAFLLLAGAAVSVVGSPALALPAALAGFVVALVTVFRKQWAPITAPIYAFLEGVFIGGISILFEATYPGIVIPAVSLTIGVFVAMLFVFRSHIIVVTDKLRIGIVAATGGVALVYLADLVLNLLGVRVAYLNEAVSGSGWLGIGVSLVVIAIAAFNLLLDFDFIERGVAARAPKYMEWYAGFGLLVTLVWLYLEILRLLARMRRR